MKKDNKFQITKAELNQIIKEEYASMAKDVARTKEIKSRLAEINEELETLPGTISEVEASGTRKVRSTGWTGAGEGDIKFGEKFEKIGTHLKEDEEMDESELGYFEAKFAELGRELDSKVGNDEMEDDSEEVEMEIELDGEDSEMEDEMEDEVGMEDEVEVEEIEEISMAEEEEIVSENLEEPIEGESPAQKSDARFNDQMEKDTHVNEGVKKGTSILSEGFTSERKSALDRELDRMKSLAKINK